MQTTTIQKRQVKATKNDLEGNELEESDEKDTKEENELKEDESKKTKKINKDMRNFFSSIDPYHRPLEWWETEHVRYAINYPPVKSRLEKLMGSHIIRLTDYKYMQKLSSAIYKDYIEQQRIRIEKRKLAPPSIISRLLEISYKALSERIRDNKSKKIKLYA